MRKQVEITEMLSPLPPSSLSLGAAQDSVSADGYMRSGELSMTGVLMAKCNQAAQRERLNH